MNLFNIQMKSTKLLYGYWGLKFCSSNFSGLPFISRKYTNSDVVNKLSRHKLRLLKRKLLLSMALKSLYKLIKQSKAGDRSQQQQDGSMSSRLHEQGWRGEEGSMSDRQTTWSPALQQQRDQVRSRSYPFIKSTRF